MLYKNWSVICQHPDVHFRLAVALSKDEGFLRLVSFGFPELFTEEEPKHVGPFPLSYIKEVVTLKMEEPGDYRGLPVLGNRSAWSLLRHAGVLLLLLALWPPMIMPYQSLARQDSSCW